MILSRVTLQLLRQRKHFIVQKDAKPTLRIVFQQNTRHSSASTMASTASSLRLVAVCQMTSRSDKKENFATCEKLIERAKIKGATMVFLPEAFDYIGENKDQTLQLAESLSGDLLAKYKQLAVKHGVWLSLGGMHEKDESVSATRIFNTHVIVNHDGEIAATYRKTHLFDVTLQSGQRLHESDYVTPGSAIVSPVDTPVGKVGLGICYDLRFPEMSIALAQMGANILTYPSAFTLVTGSAHWEILLRSRAIENQCYVIAAAQTGTHNPKRVSFGHAMVVDPWGFVVAQCHEGTDVAVAEIDLNFVQKVHQDMPVWNHRRKDLYGEIRVLSKINNVIDDDGKYRFGQVALVGTQLFLKTALSMAFVNTKPVVLGHVLVAPQREAIRISDLSPEEVGDLFLCVQRVQKVLEKIHGVSSSTVSVQDGPNAGQSIKHVHVHVLPRRPGDFKVNDMIYQELEKHDKQESGRIARTEEQMWQEARELRTHFVD